MFLGAYLERVTGRRMKIWPGECHVHAGIQPDDVSRAMAERPGVDLLIHPECGCASQCMYAAATTRPWPAPRTCSRPRAW